MVDMVYLIEVAQKQQIAQAMYADGGEPVGNTGFDVNVAVTHPDDAIV